MIHFRAMNRSDIPLLVKMSRDNMASIIRSAWGLEWRDEPLLEWLMSKDVETEVYGIDSAKADRMPRLDLNGGFTRYAYDTPLTVIMRHVEAKAVDADYEGVELVVQMTNEGAQRFYRHLGYRKVCRKGNNYLMRKTLIGPGKD